MCSVILLRRPGHSWPLLVAANRDEMKGRPWRPPSEHWPDRPGVMAGLDELAGGSWLGLNRDGVVAAILNRHGTLGPAEGKRSRGELVLEALDHADAGMAAEALACLDGRAWRPFNLVVADNCDAFLLSWDGRASGRLQVQPIPAGLSMVTAFDLNDQASDPRIACFLPRFRHAGIPRPEAGDDAGDDAGDWGAWQDLLASPAAGGLSDTAGMCFMTASGFGTSSSSLLAVPGVEQAAGGTGPHWLFSAGAPGSVPWQTLLPKGSCNSPGASAAGKFPA